MVYLRRQMMGWPEYETALAALTWIGVILSGDRVEVTSRSLRGAHYSWVRTKGWLSGGVIAESGSWVSWGFLGVLAKQAGKDEKMVRVDLEKRLCFERKARVGGGRVYSYGLSIASPRTGSRLNRI